MTLAAALFAVLGGVSWFYAVSYARAGRRLRDQAWRLLDGADARLLQVRIARADLAVEKLRFAFEKLTRPAPVAESEEKR